MNVGSLFSGIGGMDLGLARAGFTHRFFCEIDPYRRSILRRHWPGVPVFEDVADVACGESVDEGEREGRGRVGPWSQNGGRQQPSVDLLAGGFPCQDLSVAGARRGLAGDRSGLFFEFARVADAVLPDGGWVLIENVPGLLSSNDGRDFAVLLATLAELGFHDLAWRVLDSRYLGVPQRRRRVFILARRARGRSASEVLLEPESGGGDFEKGGTQGQELAGSLGKRSARSHTELDGHGAYVASVTSKWRKGTGGPAGDESQNLISHTLKRPTGGQHIEQDYIASATTNAHGMRAPAIATRHLDDPGWPNPRPDGPRYAACGDAVTVNVAQWIGERLMAHEA